eukprot:3941944-Rhodomonas_salina.8
MAVPGSIAQLPATQQCSPCQEGYAPGIPLPLPTPCPYSHSVGRCLYRLLRDVRYSNSVGRIGTEHVPLMPRALQARSRLPWYLPTPLLRHVRYLHSAGWYLPTPYPVLTEPRVVPP